ncbi:MAG TPA: preprotein translocase subunit Sec61beta [Candidatus Nanoarchaeia archaeon]|nr:preprotein translocase subunit Sec61beta [Candidatus Nanoarchaeia archaeon]
MSDKIRMPASGGGLVSYAEDSKSKIHIPPLAVIIMIVVVTLVELYFYKFT